jgi:hypothetical protein
MTTFNLNSNQFFAIVCSRDVNCVGQELQYESKFTKRRETLKALHDEAIALPHGFLLAAVRLIPSEPGWCIVDHVFYGHAE